MKSSALAEEPKQQTRDSGQEMMFSMKAKMEVELMKAEPVQRRARTLSPVVQTAGRLGLGEKKADWQACRLAGPMCTERRSSGD